MRDLDPVVRQHQRRLLDVVEDQFRRRGESLSPELRRAFLELPRHRFISSDSRAAAEETFLEWAYENRPRKHKVNGAEVATDSDPAFILAALQDLNVRTGDRVLEIGSGGGFLLAMIASLVGPSGLAVGVELISELATRAERVLREFGLRNTAIIAGDGGRGCKAHAPYDRAIVTASAWDFPVALLDQVQVGGRVVAPISLIGPGDCLAVLERTRTSSFRSTKCTLANFVPFVGRTGPRYTAWEDLPVSFDIAADVSARRPLPNPRARGIGFRAFLTRHDRGFVAIKHRDGFQPAIVIPREPSLAVWRGGELIGYGSNAALERYVEQFRAYDALGRRGDSFGIEVFSAAGPKPCFAGTLFRRGESVLAWRDDP